MIFFVVNYFIVWLYVNVDGNLVGLCIGSVKKVGFFVEYFCGKMFEFIYSGVFVVDIVVKWSLEYGFEYLGSGFGNCIGMEICV